MNEAALISVHNVSKKYCKNLKSSLWYGAKDIANELIIRQSEKRSGQLRRDEFWALRDISFELRRGESLAIIGANGAGKSTLLKLLYGLIKPDSGEVHMRGSIGAMIELGVGFDPVLSGRENIFIRAAVLGLSKNKVNELYDQIIDFTGLEDFIDSPIQYYSAGMIARLSYAISMCMNPDILLVDEVLAVGDLDFQRKCTNQMIKYLSSGGSIILVSHNPNHIQSICRRGILLEHGIVNYEGTSVGALDKYFQNNLDKISANSIDSQIKTSKENNSLIIEEVILETVHGEPIQNGKDCRLTVKYYSSCNFENVIWGFSTWTQDNFVNITGNYDLNPRIIKKGHGEFSCVIPKMPFMPGTYLLKVVIADLISLQTIASIGIENVPIKFFVHTEQNFLHNLVQKNNQLLMIKVSWD